MHINNNNSLNALYNLIFYVIEIIVIRNYILNKKIRGQLSMSEKNPECPLYNPLNCKEYYNPKLCAFVRKDKVCLKKKKPKPKKAKK